MPEKPCAFCDRTMIEERIIGEDRNFYVIASLGQITDGGYVVIAPKRHTPCVGTLTAEGAAKLLEVADFTKRALKETYGKDSTIFEHGIVGQTITHAHLHIVPVVLDFEKRIRRDFSTSEMSAVISLRDLPRLYALNREPYLFWKTPEGSSMICWNPPAPDYYLRRVAAEMLGRPERASWRAMDPELDRALWTETVKKLRPYFNV